MQSILEPRNSPKISAIGLISQTSISEKFPSKILVRYYVSARAGPDLSPICLFSRRRLERQHVGRERIGPISRRTISRFKCICVHFYTLYRLKNFRKKISCILGTKIKIQPNYAKKGILSTFEKFFKGKNYIEFAPALNLTLSSKR